MTTAAVSALACFPFLKLHKSMPCSSAYTRNQVTLREATSDIPSKATLHQLQLSPRGKPLHITYYITVYRGYLPECPVIDKFNVTCPNTGHSIKVTQICDGKPDCTGGDIALDEYQCQEKEKEPGKLMASYGSESTNCSKREQVNNAQRNNVRAIIALLMGKSGPSKGANNLIFGSFQMQNKTRAIKILICLFALIKLDQVQRNKVLRYKYLE